MLQMPYSSVVSSLVKIGTVIKESPPLKELADGKPDRRPHRSGHFFVFIQQIYLHVVSFSFVALNVSVSSAVL